jgi:hypothetical protein
VPATVIDAAALGFVTVTNPPLNATLVTVPDPTPFVPGCPIRLIFQSAWTPDPPVAVTLMVSVVPEYAVANPSM